MGRPLDHRSNLEATDLAAAARGVIKTLIPVHLGVKDKQGRDYVLRIRPYRTRENKIDGAVIIFIDAGRPQGDVAASIQPPPRQTSPS